MPPPSRMGSTATSTVSTSCAMSKLRNGTPPPNSQMSLLLVWGEHVEVGPENRL